MPDEAPKIKKQTSEAQRYYIIAMMMLMIPTVMAGFYYEGQAFRQISICALTAFVSEWSVKLMFRKSMKSSFDFGSLFTGAMIALCLPANAPVYVGVSASMFAVLVASLPFGGTHKAPFIPAAAGMAFVAVCFKDAVFSYPPIAREQSESIISPGVSLASLLQKGIAPGVELTSMFEIVNGNVSGPMGSGSLPLLVGALFFTILLSKEAFSCSAGFFSAMAAMAAIFPRVPTGSLNSLLLELSAGTAMLCGICLIHNPASRPKHWAWCIAYGMYTAVAAMCFRYFGAFEEGVWFAILFANGTWGVIQNSLTRLWRIVSRDKGKGGSNPKVLEA